MTPQELIEKGKDVIRIEARSLTALIDRIDISFANAIQKIAGISGRVVLTGVGKSGLIARKIVATFNSTGTPSIYLHPTDALHGDLGMVRSEDVVIILSKSGASDELSHLIPMLKRMNVFLIGMLGNPEAAIASEMDIVLDVTVHEEACPFDLAPTASTTASLAMGDALAVALLTLRNFTPDDFALLHPGGSLGKRLSLKISEIMIKGSAIPVVSEAASLKDTILEITSKRLGAACVINDQGVLSGMITDGDLRRLLEKTLVLSNLTALDIMTRNPKVISPHILASLALQMLEKHKITSLIVVDEMNKPIGLIHLHDLVHLGLRQR